MSAIIVQPRYNAEPTATWPAECSRTGPAGNAAPTHRCDMSRAFRPHASQFRHVHGISEPITVFDNGAPHAQRRSEILDAIRAARPGVSIFAYFGHGLSNAMSSAGFYEAHIPELARALNGVCAPAGMAVLLYACSTGEPGGFASKLAAQLKHATVYGHIRPGPDNSNPRVVRYPGGRWVVPQSSPLWSRWVRALRTTDLWARFFLYNDQQLTRILDPASVLPAGMSMAAP